MSEGIFQLKWSDFFFVQLYAFIKSYDFAFLSYWIIYMLWFLQDSFLCEIVEVRL